MRLLSVLALLFAVVLIVVAPEASGGGGTPITTCGKTVTTNAVLPQDLNCPGSPGVVVGASGITIDLRGFTLRGDRTAGDYGIDDSGGYDKVAIKNGTLSHFDFGIDADGADNLQISSLLAAGNSETGFGVFGASASITRSTA